MKKKVKKRSTVDKTTLLSLVNPRKVQILEILKKEQKQNQMDLKKKLDISYKGVRRYINDLEKQGLIKKKPFKKKQGSPVFISLKKRKN